MAFNGLESCQCHTLTLGRQRMQGRQRVVVLMLSTDLCACTDALTAAQTAFTLTHRSITDTRIHTVMGQTVFSAEFPSQILYQTTQSGTKMINSLVCISTSSSSRPSVCSRLLHAGERLIYGSSPVSLSRLKLGKLKVVRRQLLQRYEHQPFVSCLAGLYGCQWRRYQRAKAQPGECCCSRLECGSFALLIVTFILTLIFLYFWSEAQNDYNDFDWFNFGNLGFWFPWSVVLLVVAAALFTYIALLLVLAVCLLSEGQRLYLHWSHKIGILVTLTFSISATAVLSDLWSKEWTTLLLSFQVTAPFLHVGGVSLMTLLSWPIALHFFRMNKRVRQVALLSLFLAVLFALYLVPLGMYSPCIKEEGTLGPAPTLIGHRGAPMLAPENTQMSFEKAVEAGGEGLETDVTIR
ncbi:glycerophosphodiester phosphodiesterase domain-containing protein 5 [Garra rufa]|uniref:glycerophosphodiester phosphodiesterase domain-containing protein 5 n=1 Tax=Garra rufa TaxID=137080 RepID=UPI003CCE7DFD